MSKCEYPWAPDCINEATNTFGVENDASICDEHNKDWDERKAVWAGEDRKRREELAKDPWNVINTCTRCKVRMPEAWGETDSAKDRGIFQSTDGHNAEVLLSGGYAEFVDPMDRPQQIAKLCHKCGHELLDWLNYDYTMDGTKGMWLGHPKEPDDFCNGWTFDELEEQ